VQPQAPRTVPERRKRKAQRSVRGGVVWIVFLAVLMTGVVAVNVAVLRQNMQLENLANQRIQLIDRNQELRSQLSQATSTVNIEGRAKAQGLVLMAPGQTTYVRLGTGGK
jgi:cell division protein FtsB